MEELDAALNELGMLSCVTKYKLDFIKDAEAGSELRRARSGSVPETRDKEVEISVNSNFVTNISIGRISPPDLSPFMKRKIQVEIEERRLSDVKTPIKCEKHACNSSHICSFVSPRRTRACLRNVPYKYSYSYSPFYLRPSVAPLSGVLSSSSSKSGGRLRGPVRFHDPCMNKNKQTVLYPLEDLITSKFSSIQLSSDSTGDKPVAPSIEDQTNKSSQEDRNSLVVSDMSKLAISSSSVPQ